MIPIPIQRKETEGDLKERRSLVKTEMETEGTQPQSQNAWNLQRWEEMFCTSRESSLGHSGLWLQVEPEGFISDC